MASITISTRFNSDETKELEDLVASTGLDRSSLVRSLLRRAMKELSTEQAILSYRKQKITLSKAAESANMAVWDFIALMDAEDLKLHYDVEEFEADINALASINL